MISVNSMHVCYFDLLCMNCYIYNSHWIWHLVWSSVSASYLSDSILYPAMLQADDEDDLLEVRMKSPFGSSFRTFDATDYKPIGESTDLQFQIAVWLIFWCWLPACSIGVIWGACCFLEQFSIAMFVFVLGVHVHFWYCAPMAICLIAVFPVRARDNICTLTSLLMPHCHVA